MTSSELKVFKRQADGEEFVGYRPSDAFYVDGVCYDPYAAMIRGYSGFTSMIDLKVDGCDCCSDDDHESVGDQFIHTDMGPQPEWSNEGDIDTIA